MGTRRSPSAPRPGSAAARAGPGARLYYANLTSNLGGSQAIKGFFAVDRDRVFDRFTRLDPDRARDGGGTGLGLAIVRDLVRAHAGTVTLGDANPGTHAIVTLPTGSPDRPATAGVAPDNRIGHGDAG